MPKSHLFRRCLIVSTVTAGLLGLSSVSTAQAAPSVSESACQSLTPTKQGDRGSAVAILQACLTYRGYMPLGVDGDFRDNTFHAVITAQKHAEITVDGVPGPQTISMLRSSGNVRMPSGCRDTDVVCTDLSKQVNYLRYNGAVRAVDTSTGSGKTYTTLQGTTAKAITPLGRGQICRKINGVRNSSSVDGKLYFPSYADYARDGRTCLQSGIAYHGSDSVPVTAKTHGCMRGTHGLEQIMYQALPVGAKFSVIA